MRQKQVKMEQILHPPMLGVGGIGVELQEKSKNPRHQKH